VGGKENKSGGSKCRKWEEGKNGEKVESGRKGPGGGGEARLFLKVVFAFLVQNFGAR
jgi:hypothetical protein